MSGQERIILAEMARPKNPKGSALKSALSTSKINSALAEVTGQEKQPAKSSKD